MLLYPPESDSDGYEQHLNQFRESLDKRPLALAAASFARPFTVRRFLLALPLLAMDFLVVAYVEIITPIRLAGLGEPLAYVA